MDKIYIAPYPENNIYMEPEPCIHRFHDTRNSRKKRRDRATWHKKHKQLLQQLAWKEIHPIKP